MTPAVFIFAFFVSGMFTIQADVRDSVTLDAGYAAVRQYLNDPAVFSRNFPGILSIRQVGPRRSEWTYEVKPPLSSARRTSYIVNERYADHSTVIFETDPGTNDYMYCRASVAAATDTTTTLTLELKLHSSRENGSDIHFLAPLFGQTFISARMRDQLMGDLTTFFTRITDELRTHTIDTHRQ